MPQYQGAKYRWFVSVLAHKHLALCASSIDPYKLNIHERPKYMKNKERKKKENKLWCNLYTYILEEELWLIDFVFFPYNFVKGSGFV